MKGLSIFLILVIIVVLGFFVLRKPADAPMPVENVSETSDEMPTAGEASVDESFDGTKEIDASASSAKWTGSKKLIKDYYDNGTIAIKSGNAVFADGILTGGEVVFDMTTITAVSTGKGDGEDKLSGHLKSADFFDVATYPEAKFVITDAARESSGTYIVTGDMTVKGKTAPVTFPIDVKETSGRAEISGMATIDRTVYDVRFGSEKFFQDLGDAVINDEFTLEFRAVTK